MEDLISVIVPVYNVEKYIKKCIDSIINQTYKNIEIILIDDGSKDNSGKICDEYKEIDKRVFVIHKNNEGVSIARNIGIEMAKGQWISFIDSDDWIEENYLEKMFNTARTKNADVVLCAYNRIWKDRVERINFTNNKKSYSSKEYLINSLNPQTGFGFCHMKLIKSDVIKDIRFNQSLKVGEDAFFNIELSNNIKKAVIVEKNIYNYRFNDNSLVRKYDKDYVTKYYNAVNAMKEYVEKKYKDNKEIMQNLYNYIAYHVLLIIVNYCYNNENHEKYLSLKKVCKIPLFRESIKKSNFRNISISRRITLLTLKLKLYVLTSIICKIRQFQFNQ